MGRPGIQERYNQWSKCPFDPRANAAVGKRSRAWTVVELAKLHCVRTKAYRLGELRKGRWPK